MGACQEPSYTIKGTVDVPSLEGAKVYLATGGWAAEHPRMDSTVVADGKYVFKGKVAEPECAWVKLVDGRNPQNPVYANLALENAEIRIHTDAEGWSEISGTAANDAYQRFSSAKRVPRRAMDTLRKRILEESAARTLDPEREKAMKATWAKHSQELRAITFDSIKCHINNPAFWNDLYVCAASHPLAEQKELLAGANARTLEVPAVKKVQERLWKERMSASLSLISGWQPRTGRKLPFPIMRGKGHTCWWISGHRGACHAFALAPHVVFRHPGQGSACPIRY